ncbi:YigZ family protein [Clostridium akagii]|uniref:YigZ family protein n=1 Tax=Clostridium akagii TaxID=91623 RepID=UPI00047C09EB|nr:YigZ family protein [Clostridium akagii]
MSYYTVKDAATFELEEKKSVFIGNVKRVSNEQEAKEFVAEIKGKHKDARHNVYAYIIGEDMRIQRRTDDGEPQGTAGIPVLDVIKKKGITDTAIVVTRYFGGILLGAGGLARAYSKVASESINKGKIVLRVKGKSLLVTVNYDLLGKLQYLFEKKKWYIDNTEYTDKIVLSLKFENEDIEMAKAAINEISSGNCSFNVGEERYYFKIENRLF